MTNNFSTEAYRSAKQLSLLTCVFLGILGLCAFLYVIFSIGMILFPNAQLNLGEGESLSITLGFIGIIGLLEVPLRILTIIFFLIWLHRAFKNLPALKSAYQEFSPGWAVGWWFIPFANLVMPFKVVRELWNESDPDFDEETGFLNSVGGTPGIIVFWWASFIISGFAGRISSAMIDNDGNTSEHFPFALIIASLFQIAAAVLAIMIVRNITQRQEKRFSRIEHSQPLIPPPPVFNESNIGEKH
ncbi:MAG TPA: DUF4328 domain-containing protein [Pyrinomonadaceae bacterium]|jgi:hypothetical protein